MHHRGRTTSAYQRAQHINQVRRTALQPPVSVGMVSPSKPDSLSNTTVASGKLAVASTSRLWRGQVLPVRDQALPFRLRWCEA